MGYAKERGKLEQLFVKINSLSSYNEKNLAVLQDAHDKFSHTLRILKNKHPEAFMSLYQNELEEVKAGKKVLKEADGDDALGVAFVSYRDIVVKALEKTIKVTTEV